MTSPRPTRLYIVGTDTDAGKTVVTCALLKAAHRAGLIALPFKPAASGPRGPACDTQRLLAASLHAASTPHAAVPDTPLFFDDLTLHHFEASLAPGVAEDPSQFTSAAPNRGHPRPTPTVLRELADHLIALESRHRTDITLIEGAGGLEVPMPGGTWQDDWIRALKATPLIVARAGLGTINHTLLTIEALRARNLDPIGFILNEARPDDDASTATNAEVIACRAQLPCLGRLGHLGSSPPIPPHATQQEATHNPTSQGPDALIFPPNDDWLSLDLLSIVGGTRDHARRRQ